MKVKAIDFLGQDCLKQVNESFQIMNKDELFPMDEIKADDQITILFTTATSGPASLIIGATSPTPARVSSPSTRCPAETP